MKRALLFLLFTVSLNAQSWRPLAPGVDYRAFATNNINVHVTRIDMRHPDTVVIASDARDHGITVSDFAKRTKAIAAINGDYFDPRMNPIGRAGGACGWWGRGWWGWWRRGCRCRGRPA